MEFAELSAESETVEEGQEPWFVYMIRAHDGSLYTGITKDVERRLAEHKGESVGVFKGAKALRNKWDLEVVFTHEVADRSQASQLEYRIKRLKKARKEALVRDRALVPELLP